MTSKKFAAVAEDVKDLIEDFEKNTYEMDWGFNKDGSYDESISNKGARELFEDLYDLAQDFVTFFNSMLLSTKEDLRWLPWKIRTTTRCMLCSWKTWVS